MTWKWTAEHPARWDDRKETIFSRIPAGVFDLPPGDRTELLPGEWWRVEDEAGRTIGYGWLDSTWAEGEVLACVDPDHQKKGVGAFIFDQLAQEARKKGHRWIANFVRETQPDRDRVTEWLLAHGFESASDGRLMRRT
mgnify:CR=1 FL=1